MSKLALKFLPIFSIILLLVVVSPKAVLANHEAQVLGESTQSSRLSIAPTSEGPGLILPDSPFFFLDQIKQNFRLFLAFTPEEKAKAHTAIAGERLAELRLMLAKNNKNGIETAIKGVSDNFAKASEDIANAQLTGRDISKLAKDINVGIKEKQKALDDLESQAGLELKPQVQAATQALLKAKVKVEDSLPSGELENEIRDDVKRLVEKRVGEASESAKKLEREINELQKQASESSKKSLTNREEALRRAIEKKNEALKKVEQKMFENEIRKQDSLFKLQQKAADEARDAIKKAQEAAIKVDQIHAVINQIRNQDSGDSGGSKNKSENKSGKSGKNSEEKKSGKD